MSNGVVIGSAAAVIVAVVATGFVVVSSRDDDKKSETTGAASSAASDDVVAGEEEPVEGEPLEGPEPESTGPEVAGLNDSVTYSNEVGLSLSKFVRGTSSEYGSPENTPYVKFSVRVELEYEPPFARDYLRQFKAMVESFEPTEGVLRAGGFPGADERAMVSCALHRILSALPYWDGCFRCTEPL